MEASNRDHRDKDLSSAEYRARLLAKLNCLIAVLEVAIAKISRSMELPGANGERLLKIRSNLENTLSICNRAKRTLEKGLASTTKGATNHPVVVSPRKELDKAERKMTYRDYVEFSSIEEYRRFKAKPPIVREDLESTDIDDLMRKLLG